MSFIRPFLPAVAICAAVLACASPAVAQTAGAIAGQVIAADTEQPLPNARVLVEGTSREVATGADGRFAVADLPAGRHTVAVSHEGFETIRTTVEVTASAPVRLEVRLPLNVALQEDVVVVGRTVGELGLAGTPATASRLNLRAIDIPASVDVLDSTVMEARGYQKVSDAVASMAGVVAGEHATAPSTFSMRGFTQSQVSTLRDGIWLGPSTIVMRPQNTFNLARVELLRGPASVVNGQGAVAGTINAITKSAEPTAATAWNGLVSYGRFNTYHTALGVTGPAARSLWYRVDVSRSGSDGYVERMDSGSFNVTGSVLWRPVQRVSVKFSADYLDDDLAKYFGTPLVPRSAAREPLDVIRTSTGETIDARTRFVNYNVSDGYATSNQSLFRADVSWQISDRYTLTNVAYRFDADRRWRNAEGYVYCTSVVDVCTAVGQITRYYGYFLINHDQQITGNRLLLNANHTIGGRTVQTVFGAEAYTLDFERTRGFRRRVPPAPGDAVDILRPVPGVYGPEELRGISPTAVDTWATFVESSAEVAPRLRLAGAIRYDELDLDRRNLSPTRVPEAGGFTRAFTWASWRAGAVYSFRPEMAAYAQYSNAKDPVSSNIFLVNANQNFDLTSSTQWEAGLKADLARGRTQITFAYFDITRDDVLERFALDSATNIGGIDSRGVELAGTFRVGDRARVGANAGLIDSAFRPSANFQRFAGNRPPNVPTFTGNAWASYQGLGGLPIEIGGSARLVGDRFANNANTITMRRYALMDAYAAWTRDRLRVTARVDNLTDRAYASWSDVFYLGQTDPSFLYANQLMLGSPRTYSLMLQVGF